MNQQRARRFRASQELALKHQEQKEGEVGDRQEKGVHEEFKSKGDDGEGRGSEELEDQSGTKDGSFVFDSNVITPGTEFMQEIGQVIRQWTVQLLQDPRAWPSLQIIVSDSNVPGEGEHKIMDFLRRQRLNQPPPSFASTASSDDKSSPSTPPPPSFTDTNSGSNYYDPNMTHVIYGLDADLIMLSMATHEPRFKVLREDVFWEEEQARRLQSPASPVSESTNSTSDGTTTNAIVDYDRKPFIFLDVTVLREYLDVEMRTSLPVSSELRRRLEPERALDDWILLCFLVGNDFLPHLPSLDIRENAIDTLIGAYKRRFADLDGHLTKHGMIVWPRLRQLLRHVGDAEDDILQRRQERLARIQQRRRPAPERDTEKENGGESPDSEEEEDPVHLGEPGYRGRYYASKFGLDVETAGGRALLRDVCAKYAEGLQWVLLYYYQGCPSWRWFYPHHYAPFARDLADYLQTSSDDALSGILLLKDAERGKPFHPFQQLMSVFPAASGRHIPAAFRPLMTEEASPIRHFYPDTFRIDLNGKRHAWQGVALLPFIDDHLLLEAMQSKYEQISESERQLDRRGRDELYVGYNNTLYGFLSCIPENEEQCAADADDTKDGRDKDNDSNGRVHDEEHQHGGIDNDGENEREIADQELLQQGWIRLDPFLSTVVLTGWVKRRPAASREPEDVMAVQYHNPCRPPGHGYFRSAILAGTRLPPPVLTDGDRSAVAQGRRSPFSSWAYRRPQGQDTGNGPHSSTNTMRRDYYDRQTERDLRGYKADLPPSSRSYPSSSSSPYAQSSVQVTSNYSTGSMFQMYSHQAADMPEQRPEARSGTGRTGGSASPHGSDGRRRPSRDDHHESRPEKRPRRDQEGDDARDRHSRR